MKIKKIVPIAVMSMIIMDFIGYYFNMNFIIYISIISILGIAALTTIENIMIICFICVPFFYLITFKLGQSSCVYYLIGIYFVKYIIEKIKRFNFNDLINKYLISLLILIVTFRNVFAIENKRYISWFILTIFFVFAYNDKNFNLKKCIKWYTISFIISSILGYIVIKQGRIELLPVDLGVVFNKWNTTYRFVGLMGETNGYAQVNLILFIVNTISLIRSKNIKNFIKYAVISAALILFGFMTYSKMYILALIIFIILLILYELYSNMNGRINISRVLAIILMCIIGSIIIVKFISSNLDSSLISNYLVRFTSKDLSTGRLEVYEYFFNLLNTNILYWYFGAGFYKYLIPWTVTGTNGICAHNIYLECTVLFGIFGVWVIMSLLLYRLVIFKKRKITFLSFLPLIIFLITGLSLHSMLTNYFYFLLLIIMGVLEKDIYSNSRSE